MGNWNQLFNQIGAQIEGLERAVTASTDSAFPIREHLLPEALSVFPADTPILNRLMPNALPGSGSAVEWRELTGFTKVGGAFYTEGSVPGDTKYTFTPQSAGYKLAGRRFGVTGFARAVGASFEDVLVRERQGAIVSLKQDLEDAIFNADSSVNPLAFDGLLKQIDAVNGSYVNAINGALALDDIDTALRETWDDGYEPDWIALNSVQAKQLNNLVLNAGTHQITLVRTEQGAVAGQARVTGLIHPVTGKEIPLIPTRNVAAGTLIGVPEKLPVHVAGRQGQRGLWWDSLLDITEVEEGVSADAVWFFLKTYLTMPFPARRGAFKLTGLV
ncbi:MAG: SU10 major capsid protein [Azonexus sp.]